MKGCGVPTAFPENNLSSFPSSLCLRVSVVNSVSVQLRLHPPPEPEIVPDGCVVFQPLHVAIGEGVVGATQVALRRALLVLETPGARRNDVQHVIPRRD